jgi:peptide chain release factor 2
MRAEIQTITSEIETSLELLRQRLGWETAQHRLEEFNARVEDPNLWNDPAKAQKLMRERQALVDALATHDSIQTELSDNIELIAMGEAEDDAAIVSEAESALKALRSALPKRSLRRC